MNGYCNGYGTIRWNSGQKYIGNVVNGKNEGFGTSYHSNGQKSYVGYWVNDMRNGKGKEYDEDGYLIFKGVYVNDEFKNFDLINAAAQEVSVYILKEVFDGGINLKSGCVGLIADENNKDFEMHIKMKFNGNINSNNYYECTAVINTKTGYFDFVDYNSTVDNYLSAKVAINGAMIAKKIYDALN